jgi:hypothetical protein
VAAGWPLRRWKMAKVNFAMSCEWGSACSWAARLYRVLRKSVGFVEARQFCPYHAKMARQTYGPAYEIQEV